MKHGILGEVLEIIMHVKVWGKIETIHWGVCCGHGRKYIWVVILSDKLLNVKTRLEAAVSWILKSIQDVLMLTLTFDGIHKSNS